MRYVSIDIETTGTDSEKHQILEFAAIIEDTKNPKSYEESKKYRRIIVSSNDEYVFSAVAAKMNAKLMATIADIKSGVKVPLENSPFLTEHVLAIEDLFSDFKLWLLANGFKENNNGVVEIVAAGKNFASFDKQFLEKAGRNHYDNVGYIGTSGIRFHYRSLDPSLKLIDWESDETPPSTDLCKKRVNLRGPVTHEALSDAWDVIQLLRINYIPAEPAAVPTAIAV